MKKMKTLLAIAAFVCTVMLSACSVTLPVTATGNEIGSKVGSAKSQQVFGFFPDGGDLSIRTAAQNGGISKISTVDFKRSLVFLWIVVAYETIVTGE